MSTTAIGGPVLSSTVQEPFIEFTAECQELDKKVEALRNRIQNLSFNEKKNNRPELSTLFNEQLRLEEQSTEVPYFISRPQSKEMTDALKAKIIELVKLFARGSENSKILDKILSATIAGALGGVGATFASQQRARLEATRNIQQNPETFEQSLARHGLRLAPTDQSSGQVVRCEYDGSRPDYDDCDSHWERSIGHFADSHERHINMGNLCGTGYWGDAYVEYIESLKDQAKGYAEISKGLGEVLADILDRIGSASHDL